MLKKSYHSIYENVYKLQKIFLIRAFWLNYIFQIKFKIPILDLMLLPKTVFHLKGYTTVVKSGISRFEPYGVALLCS